MSRQIVLITGCSAGGIGFGLAKEFHRRGLRVLATARRVEAMNELATLGIETLPLDVTKEDSISACKDRVAQLTEGKLDILVNNAGKFSRSPATDLPLDKVRDLFETNVFSVFAMIQAFTPLLVANGGGKILNIGSLNAISPVPLGSAYGASKAALHQYGNILRVELKPFNIKVITAVTGGVQTNGTANSETFIPSTSLYAPFRETLLEADKKLLEGGSESLDSFSKGLVSKVLQSNPAAWVWGGNSALLVRLLSTFGSVTTFDGPFSRMFKLDLIAKQFNASRKS
ncbi:NAD(P)-binding protein [Sistotremastrum suecicum HHB10207 ss-3]|uniref:NAD(P)-binding protein n=1 Tax=Sistotremastrum suecicum HHB10207 ss-3 TaxID=1314776 RepID=A0A165YP56_9AGAM|nr:NAD(P)-binding protein [Sistotremastrum suecicum HHB10207 ss-3]